MPGKLSPEQRLQPAPVEPHHCLPAPYRQRPPDQARLLRHQTQQFILPRPTAQISVRPGAAALPGEELVRRDESRELRQFLRGKRPLAYVPFIQHRAGLRKKLLRLAARRSPSPAVEIQSGRHRLSFRHSEGILRPPTLPPPSRCSSIPVVPAHDDLTPTAPAAGDTAPREPASALHRALRPVRTLHARGPASFINLNLYSFGLTGLWTAVGSVILPLMISGMIAREVPIRFLGFELQKNGAISVIAIIGGLVVGVTQPLAGWLSDRTSGPLGKRLPYMAVGTLGLLPIIVILGGMNTFVPLILIFIGIQFFGNLAQGPANALLLDHVPPRLFGSASGALILTRALGAGLVVAAVLGLMSHYDAVDSPQWLWASLAVVSAVVILTVSWTFTTLRPRRDERERAHPLVSIDWPSAPEPTGATPATRELRRRGYVFLLVVLTVIVAGTSSMSVYAVFYMEDMVAPENPAGALLLVMAIMVPTVGLTVIPAGRLSDRIGRTRMLVGAGLIGAFGVLLLAFFPELPIVLVAAIPIAISVAGFFTVLWALANDLVAPGSAARDLGFTGIAFLVGGVAARFAGFAVDALNNQSENLGYRALLFVIAAAFVLMPIALQRSSRR